MNLSCVIPFLLLVAMASAAPNTGHRDDTVNGLRVILALISTSEGGINHAYWFRRLFDTQLSPEELRCAKNATVYHPDSRRCEWLFEQGPCAARQWLVLDRQGSGGGLRPVCRRRPCAPGYGFLADAPRCAPQDQLCADSGRVFRYSLRGEGRCHCKGFRAQGPDGKCHVLFVKGPCPHGQVLAPTYHSLDSLRGVCVRDPCTEGHVRVEAEDGRESKCHELDGLDCSLIRQPLFDQLVSLDVPVCDYSKRNTIKIPTRPQSCVRDNRGVCTTYYVRSPEPYNWDVELNDDAIIFRDKRAETFLTKYLSDFDMFYYLAI